MVAGAAVCDLYTRGAVRRRRRLARHQQSGGTIIRMHAQAARRYATSWISRRPMCGAPPSARSASPACSGAILACACPRASRTSRPIGSGELAAIYKWLSRWTCWLDCTARRRRWGFGSRHRKLHLHLDGVTAAQRATVSSPPTPAKVYTAASWHSRQQYAQCASGNSAAHGHNVRTCSSLGNK